MKVVNLTKMTKMAKVTDLTRFRQIRHFRQFCHFPDNPSFARSLKSKSFWQNFVKLPNLPFSTTSLPSRYPLFCSLPQIQVFLAKFHQITNFAKSVCHFSFVKMDGEILSNLPFSLLHAFLDISQFF